MPSSIATTISVLSLDVFALWILDFALLRVAAYLNGRVLYDEHNSVEISDVWFEGISGHSHGPMWFRKSQVVLKMLLLVCSMIVGLSIDGFAGDRLLRLPDQTVVVRRDRRLSKLGIGGYKNFSSEVLFVLETFSCGFDSPDISLGTPRGNLLTVLNAQSLVPIGHEQYGVIPAVECLSEKNNFSEPAVLRVGTFIENVNECGIRLPSRQSIQSGIFNISVIGCPWRLTQSHCQAVHHGSCAFTLERGEDQVLTTVDYRTSQNAINMDSAGIKTWRRRDLNTIQIVAKYLDFGLEVNPRALDYLTAFEAEKRSIMKVNGTALRTRIDLRKFLSGLIIMLATISAFVLYASVLHVTMMRNKRSEYALGLRVAEVARFALAESASSDAADIPGNSLFLEPHSDFPHLTVSGVNSL